MTRLIHSLALLVIIMLVLVSCNIGSTSTGESLTIQNSPASQAAILELSVQVDTSIPYTTVGQIINFNLYVKNVGNAGVSGQATVTGAAATCPPINTIGNLNDSLDPNGRGPPTTAATIRAIRGAARTWRHPTRSLRETWQVSSSDCIPESARPSASRA